TQVSLVTVQARPTIVIPETTTWEEFPHRWRPLLDEVYAFVRASPELADTPSWQNVMFYKDHTPSVEIGVLAPGPFIPSGRVIASELPAGEVATATHIGDYADLGLTHRAVLDYMADHGLEMAGPRWEIYGHWREDPREVETEIYWLI